MERQTPKQSFLKKQWRECWHVSYILYMAKVYLYTYTFGEGIGKEKLDNMFNSSSSCEKWFPIQGYYLNKYIQSWRLSHCQLSIMRTGVHWTSSWKQKQKQKQVLLWGSKEKKLNIVGLLWKLCLALKTCLLVLTGCLSILLKFSAFTVSFPKLLCLFLSHSTMIRN